MEQITSTIFLFMPKTRTFYQSYLITGNSRETSKESQKIASTQGININKPSPDISVIEPIKKHISIDQIREIKKTIYQKPISQKHKLVIIKNAEKLTKEAQNSLLKIFEEPPQHAIIILEAKDKSSLLSTIVSRSITIQTTPVKKTDELNPNLLSNKNQKTFLEEISEIEDPTNWLDNQMQLIHQELLAKIRRRESTKNLQETFEKCSVAKKMIEANVHPKFVLTNLIFSIKPDV